jgi:putative transposase
MPFIKVYIHFVWSTKDRIPYLDTLELRTKMWNHIKENAIKKEIHIDFVNGYNDHCHCLVSLGTEQTISKIMQLIKGESAFWFNQQNYISEKLQWQDEYYAMSVSQSAIEKVRNYIKKQEEHHKKKSFQEEQTEIIEKYGFQKFND